MSSTRSRSAVLLDGPPAPRHRVAPSARSNSWEDVADLAASLGMPLDEWQEYALEAAMGERADGRWVSKFVGISAPRQNGKSQIIVARALAGVLLFNEKMIIISAHETDTARTVWKRLLDLIEGNPSLEARVTGRMDAIGREFVSFGKGQDKQTIKLKARQKSGARGFSADCLLLDEAQILGKSAWGSIVPTMSAMPNPQMWLFGTPPTTEDDPFAFTRVRSSALAKKPRHAWLEWSADPDDDFGKPETWAKANPSYGVRISREACADDRAAMDDDQFALERLGIWTDASRAVVPVMPNWSARKVSSPPPPVAAIAVAVDPDRVWISIGAASEGDVPHLGSVIRRRMDSDRAFVVAEVARIQRERRCAVVLDRKGPASSLERELEAAGVEITAAGLDDYVTACADLFDAVDAGRVTHGDYDDLNAAVAAADKRKVGDRWAWSRRNGDVSMLEAVTLAMWGAGQQVESVYEQRGALVL